MTRKDIERLLADQPVPPPPADLAAKIRDEIPEDLGGAERPSGGTVVPLHRRPAWRLAAAAAVTLALTGAVTWELMRSQPGPSVAALAELEVPTSVPARQDEAQTAGTVDRQVEARPVAELRDETGRQVATGPQGVSEEVGEDGSSAAPTPPRHRGAEAEEERVTGRDRRPSPDTRSRGGSLDLKVTDPEGLPLPGATIVARSPAMQGTRTTMANVAGDARMKFLPEGEYDLDISLSGFCSRSAEDVKVKDEGTTTLDVNLQPLQVEEFVVTSEAPSVDVPSSASASATLMAPLSEPGRTAEAARRHKGRMVVPTTGEQSVAVRQAPPSTGGTAEPNDAPYGDVFFAEAGVNPFIDTEDDRLSTFGLDVDTGSYTVIRRYLRDGHLPPREAVRVEEVVNAFDYGDQPPRRGDFRLTAEAAPTPFGEGDRYAVVRFGLRARDVDASARPPAHLVFVVDVSGSMARENRLGLVKKALFELLGSLRADDTVALVVFGSTGRVVLEPTENHERIRCAIESLAPSGSTNAEEGLVLAYELAARRLDEPGIHRVILCSDGVANVGRTGPESILERIAGFAEQGIELTTVGFGMGNYNDVLMERLADTGDGRYAYVDTLAEARRLFVEELTGTLLTVARDAKAQVEFDPDVVSRYRLLGYENRDIADERFRDPTVDAGEIGAGHSVTALYEVKLRADAPRRGTLATLRLRYRSTDGDGGPVELEQRIGVRDLAASWADAPASLRLASLVAEYAEVLKGSYWARTGDLRDVLRRAQELAPSFAGDTRVADWVSLVATAAELRDDEVERRD